MLLLVALLIPIAAGPEELFLGEVAEVQEPLELQASLRAGWLGSGSSPDELASELELGITDRAQIAASFAGDEVEGELAFAILRDALLVAAEATASEGAMRLTAHARPPGFHFYGTAGIGVELDSGRPIALGSLAVSPAFDQVMPVVEIGVESGDDGALSTIAAAGAAVRLPRDLELGAAITADLSSAPRAYGGLVILSYELALAGDDER